VTPPTSTPIEGLRISGFMALDKSDLWGPRQRR
jgi:hypothetical protein